VKRVVSVSLGTSKRDKRHEVHLLGQDFLVERLGTDGDTKKFENLFRELDGQIACFGVGGADLVVAVGSKRYRFKQIERLTEGAKKTPVVDGSGLKHTLERETIRFLVKEGIVDFSKERVLLVSAVDRFGMAQALVEAGANVVYGDLAFGLGIPARMRTYNTVKALGSIILPIITKLPQQWIYPVGEKQEHRTPKFGKFFEEATIIAGDWHFIRRYAPDNLNGKTIITQTVREKDIEWLRSAGVKRLITTTPEMGGETFATNVMEALLVAASGKRPEELGEEGYVRLLKELNWTPNIKDL
jgi:hypothetical protein